jgi:sec-independent protein translocase protein TatC
MTEMSFLEHLQELRKRLIICIVALFIAAAVAWPLSYTVQRFIQRPLLQPSVVQDLKYDAAAWIKERYPQLSERLGIQAKPPQIRPHRLNYMAPLEPFFVQMKISLITGFALAFPVILYQIWLFFAPALYPREKKYIYLFLPFGSVAFVLGALFCLYMVWPLIISFSLTYESDLLYSMLNLTQYVDFCLRLLLLFGLIFELPLILLILNWVGIVKLDALRHQRRLALLLSAVVAAFHADLVTMTAVAIPIYCMYELSIILVRLFGRRAQAEPEPVLASVPAPGPGLDPPVKS